jgi:sporulation related protein
VAIPSSPDPAGATRTTDRSPMERRAVWRVQIYASPALQEADRVAKDASAKLGEGYVLEFEGTLYKVRLGAFQTEDAARDLRERAIRLGYAGAFRMREDAEITPPKE